MSADLRRDEEPTFAALVDGIIDDARDLMTQQFALLRQEVQGEIRQARTAAISLGVGGVIVALGLVFLLITLVHLIATYTTLPLWAAYGLVTLVLCAAGAGLLLLGRKEAADVHLLPPRHSAGAFKETLAWLRRKTTSLTR